MGLNAVPSSERVHIAIFGKRNAGKSSLINAITGQELAIVSEVKGTTTDPVYKAMELLPLGPVVMIDTPGLDDEGELGEQRVKKAIHVLNKTDIAILVISAEDYLSVEQRQYTDSYEEKEKSEVQNQIEKTFQFENELLPIIKEKKIPVIVVLNKIDLLFNQIATDSIIKEKNIIGVSAKTGQGIQELKNIIAKQIPQEEEQLHIVGDLLEEFDLVLLVVPIDSAAPKGRLILPQQQTIRDILDANAIAVVTKETELKQALESIGKKPKMVITDSQVFEKVAMDTPEDILLTSFSILFARYKGELEEEVKGALFVEKLQDGDKVLIAEGCTHHRQCDDIGTVKIPRWLTQYTKKELIFEYKSGTEYSDNLSEYAMIIHCGGCMLNRREMKYRINKAKRESIPIVNYGVLIAYMKGILKRAIQPFTDIIV